MYTVTQDFMDAMKAHKRKVDAKLIIDFTDAEIDQSLQASASERANVSYPQQTADGVQAASHKWASLDGTWKLDGTYHLAPKPEDLARFQFGWWGKQLASTGGALATPYPALTITHIPRPIHTLQLVGDSVRQEWPVDFSVQLYGPDDTLLHTETVTGNSSIQWAKTLSAPVLDVARQVLTITRWSHEGRQAKILEFFTSIQETYYSGDVVEISLLEEREASQGSLPVGNITANEIAIRLANVGGKFDVTNQQSPLWGLLKPNRRIRALLGVLGESDLLADGWYGAYDWDCALQRRDDGSTIAPELGYIATVRPNEGRFGGAVELNPDGSLAYRIPTSSGCTLGAYIKIRS